NDPYTGQAHAEWAYQYILLALNKTDHRNILIVTKPLGSPCRNTSKPLLINMRLLNGVEQSSINCFFSRMRVP
ncbi:hypothetical protein ACJX0J_025563, partial [Zea mays]